MMSVEQLYGQVVCCVAASSRQIDSFPVKQAFQSKIYPYFDGLIKCYFRQFKVAFTFLLYLTYFS